MNHFLRKPVLLTLAAIGVAASIVAWAQSSSPAPTANANNAAPTVPATPNVPSVAPTGALTGAPAGAPAAGAPQPPAPVEVIKVSKGSVLEDVSATGTVKANESVMMRPEIAGRIAKINFRDGDQVCRGQILIELDASLQQAEKEQIQAELNLAISNFKRNEDLANKNFVSPRVKEEAESQVKVAQAKLALAEARFQRALVRAPFNGVLGLRNVSVGEYVKDGADLVTLDDLSRLRIDFKLPERYAAQAKVGMKVMIEPDAALKLRGLAGKVDSIDSVLDTNGRALTLRTRIPNPRGMLKPGMFVKTKLVLSERDGALMIPDETVSAQGRDMIVYKVAEGKAVRSVVKTGVRQLGKIEIIEGLAEGDTIIQAGLQRINRDGQPVRIVEPRAGGPGAGGPAAAGGKPADGKPADGKPGDTKPSGAKPSDAKPADSKAAGGKPPSAKPGAGKPVAGKPSDKPDERKVVCPPDTLGEGRGEAKSAPNFNARGTDAQPGSNLGQGQGVNLFNPQGGAGREPRKP